MIRHRRAIRNSEFGIRNGPLRTPHFAFRIAIGCTWLCWLATAEAGLSVSPARVVLEARPKQTLVGYFTVGNDGQEPLGVEVEPEDWTYGLSGSRDQVSWLSVKPARLTIPPGKSARVKYTIRVPADAHGELRTQVFFTMTSDTADSLRSRLGAIIYVAVKGTTSLSGSISRLDVSYTASTPGVEQPDHLDMLIGVANGSNVHVVPEGTVVIRDRDGQPVATLVLAPGWGLLPGEEDAYHAIGYGVHLKPGTYTVELAVVLGVDLHQPTTVTKTAHLQIDEQGAAHLLPDAPPTPNTP